MNADAMALEAMALGRKHHNLDATMDVELAVDENLLSPSVRAKALRWLSGSSRTPFRPRATGSSYSKNLGKGKRGWVKRDGRWVATR